MRENRRRRALTLVALSLTLCAGCASAKQDLQRQRGFRIQEVSTPKTGERLSLRLQGSTAVLELFSPAGIGRARLVAGSGGWPRRVLVRLHLQALEGFEAWNGSQHFVHALSHEENVRRHRRQRNGAVLEPIEEELPASLLQDNPDWVQIQWVDWYRG